jgi:DNA polymerase III delta prime subunit
MGKRVKAASSDEEDAESDTALKGTSKPRAKKARKVGIKEPEPEKDRPKKKRKSIFDYSSDEDEEEEEEVVIKPATKRVPKPPKPTQPRKAKDSGAAEDKDTGPAKSDNAAKPEKQKPAKPAPKPVEKGPISLSSDSETGDEQPRRRVSSKPAKTLSAVAAKQKPSTPKRTLPDPEEETIDFDSSDGDADSSKPVPKSSSAGDTLVSKPKPSASGEPKKRGITAFLVPFSQMAKPPSSQDQVERVPCTELWVDKYAPGRTKELAVHAKKVDEVREWVGGSLGRAGRRERRVSCFALVKPVVVDADGSRQPRIFFLTGPSGSGKTATVRAVCQELGVGISEWINPESESSRTELSIDTDSLSLRFSDFLRQASRFGSSGLDFVGSSLEPKDSTPTVILIEDIPNIASSPSLRAAFHASLLNYAQSSSRTPLILIASDVGSGWDDSERDSVITPRTVLPAQLRSSIAATITELKFNPVAHSLLVTMLKSLAEKERQGIGRSVTPEEIDVLASRSGGDLRCAINALQFMALLDTKVTSPDKGKKEKGRKKIEERVREAEKRVGQAVGNGRESTLPLFHALGKVLYNKSGCVRVVWLGVWLADCCFGQDERLATKSRARRNRHR